jgi:hypothetical protein
MNKQNGFSAVIVLLSILVITALGFTGYYVWNTQQDKNATTSDTQPAVAGAKEDSSKVAEQQVKQTLPNNQDYLVIEEWGVKIPVDKKYSDLSIKKYCDAGNECAFIYSPTQIDLANKISGTCYKPLEDNNIGIIVRYKDPNASRLGATLKDFYPPSVKLGEWYYGYGSPAEATCMYGNANPANNDLSDYYLSSEKDMVEYIKKIQEQ